MREKTAIIPVQKWNNNKKAIHKHRRHFVCEEYMKRGEKMDKFSDADNLK